MLQQVPLERRKEVGAKLGRKVEEFNVKRTKQWNANVIEQRQGVHILANLAGWHTYSSYRRVTAIPDVRLELVQAWGFRAEVVSTLGINKLILLLKEHCQGLRADGDLISLVVPVASEPLLDQQVNGDNKTSLPRTSMVARSQALQDEQWLIVAYF
jgi:hypothetical protein